MVKRDPSAIDAALERARVERRSIEPFTDGDPGLSPEDAYAVQDLGIAARLRSGETLVGAKLGLTSLAKQRAMSVDEPLFGWLTSAMRRNESEPLDLSSWIHPRVEPEVCFLFHGEVCGPISAEGVLAATSSVCVALEVIDSRFSDFRFRLPDVIADNASAAGFLLGADSRPPSEVGDLSALTCFLQKDGEEVATATGADVMGNPANAVAWLVNQLARRGRSLPAGSIVLSGGMTDAVSIQPGSHVSAQLSGLGSIEVYA